MPRTTFVENRLSSLLLTIALFITCLGFNALTGYADGCSAVNFKAARDFQLGVNYYALTTGDFNGDGKADVAAADYSANAVKLSFGNGSGAFLNTTSTTVGMHPSYIVAGDMNNDGKLDLVTSNAMSNDVSVLINNGAGVFTVTSYGAGVGPGGVTLADFNSDGKLDVATTNATGGAVVILLNNGSGGLLPLSFISLPAVQPRDLVAGDFNTDGKADLAVVSYPGGLHLLTGTGTGTFNPPTFITTNVGPQAIAAGDFTGDGKLDVVTINYSTRQVGILPGTGTGTFLGSIYYATGGNPSDVELRDINLDGHLDIVIANYIADTPATPLRIIYGNGASGVLMTQDVVAGFYSRGVTAGDFNSDGKPDVVTIYSDLFGSGVSVALNDGTGKLETAVSTGAVAEFALLYDVNADGKLDLLTISFSSLQIRLGLGDSGGNFAAPTTFATVTGIHLTVGDFNGDGRPDIAAANGNNVAILLNTGGGNFSAPVNYNNGSNIAGLVTGDYTGDGKLDIVVASFGDRTVKFFTGNGTGSFLLTGVTNLGANPAAILSGDFNNDGKLDVVTANQCSGPSCTSKVLTLLAGNGMGGFAVPADISDVAAPNLLLLNPQQIAAGDFNADGKLDLTYTNFNNTFVNRVVAYNAGGANFTSTVALASSTDTGTSAVGDINSDGKPDIVLTGGGYSREVKVYLNNGSGFDAPVAYTGVGDRTIALGDINADGKRDILFGDSNSGLFKMLNKCALTRGKATTDFDGDGITDLSVFRPSTGTWYIIYSSDNSFHAIPFGANGDIPVPGDYEGDGRTDVAIFRPSNGTWYYLRSSDGQFAYQSFGANGDIPVQGDYDGDGKTNFAVFRPSTGTWFTSLNPATNYGAVVWGTSTDTPVPADYDGDGRTDIAVFRPSTAYWYLLQSSQGYREQQFGVSTDTPVPADYDGDGKDEFAVFRSSTGTWYTSLNPATNYGAIPLGQAGDVPVPGYYDGDGRVDAAVFRQGDWYIFQTTTNSVRGVHFGASGDVPAPFAP